MEGFQIIRPVPPLSYYVEHYWYINIDKLIFKDQFIKVIPQGYYDFVINYKVNYFENSNHIDLRLSPYTLVGPSVKYKDFGIKGEIGVFAITFKPYGLFLLNDIKHLAKNYTPIELISRDLNRLKDILIEVDSNHQRINISNKFLLELFKKSLLKNKKIRIPIEHIINEIKNNRGCINIKELANEYNCSLSKLERNFNDCVGITPKQYARIIRFNEVLNILNINNYNYLRDFIFKMGYYDQSHFINEFKNFMGTTPKNYLKIRERFDPEYYLTKSEYYRLNKEYLMKG